MPSPYYPRCCFDPSTKTHLSYPFYYVKRKYLFVGLYVRAIGNNSSLEIWPLWSHAQCTNCSVSAL